jgi:glycosyltransferase involved in cell wall biosynthesis
MVGLNKDRFEANLACAPEGRLEDEALTQGIIFRPIRHFVRRVSLYNDITALFELMRLIRQHRYDVVHTHNSKAGILGRIAAKCCGVPIIIHTMHSCVFRYPNLNIIQRGFYYYLEKFAASFTDKIITISHPLEEVFIKAKIAPPNKFITIYSGVEIDKFRGNFDVNRKKQEFGIKSSDLVVGTVARLAQGKGHKIFLRTAARISKHILNVKFMIVGDGPLKQELVRLSKGLKIYEKCIFTDFRRDVEQIAAIFDVAVLASFYEGMSRVLLEAQALGKPVVATKVGGIPDIVNEGVTGILVPPKDVDALSVAMIKLLKNESLRKQMGEEAKTWVDFRFSNQKMVDDITRVYEEFIVKKLGVRRGF